MAVVGLSAAPRAPERTTAPARSKGGGVLYYGILLALAYVFMVDGSVRLRTGSSSTTLFRDAIPVTLTLGWLLVNAGQKTRRQMPAGGGLAAVIAAIAVVQLWNPDTVSLVSGLKALRPHLEFLPLMLLGYEAIRTERQLEGLAVLMAIAGAANGVMSIVQSGLGLAQFASWGPGYAAFVHGSSGLAAATYVTSSGHVALLPPALGATLGFGGGVGLVALPFALALVLRARRRSRRVIGAACVPLILAGVLTSQTRAAVIGAIITTVAILVLLYRGRPSTVALLLLLFVATAVGVLALGVSVGHYSSVAPARLVNTFGRERASSLALVPTYATHFPLGAGLGTAGPGATAHSSVHAGKLNGENEFTYLLVELGIPGLVAFVLLGILTIWRGLRVSASPTVSRLARGYLAAITAGLIGCAVLSFVASISGSPPFAPFLWLAVGVIAAWLPRRARQAPTTFSSGMGGAGPQFPLSARGH